MVISLPCLSSPRSQDVLSTVLDKGSNRFFLAEPLFPGDSRTIEVDVSADTIIQFGLQQERLTGM